VHTNQGDQLQLDLHLPSAERHAEGEPDDPVRELWLQRMLEQRLRSDTICSNTESLAIASDKSMRGLTKDNLRTIEVVDIVYELRVRVEVSMAIWIVEGIDGLPRGLAGLTKRTCSRSEPLQALLKKWRSIGISKDSEAMETNE